MIIYFQKMTLQSNLHSKHLLDFREVQKYLSIRVYYSKALRLFIYFIIFNLIDIRHFPQFLFFQAFNIAILYYQIKLMMKKPFLYSNYKGIHIQKRKEYGYFKNSSFRFSWIIYYLISFKPQNYLGFVMEASLQLQNF